MSKRAREVIIVPEVVDDVYVFWDDLVPDVQRTIVALLTPSARFAFGMTNRAHSEGRDTSLRTRDILFDAMRCNFGDLFDFIVEECFPLDDTWPLINMMTLALSTKQSEIITRFQVTLGSDDGSLCLALGSCRQYRPRVTKEWCEQLGYYGNVTTIYAFSPFLSDAAHRHTLTASLAKHDHAETLRKFGFGVQHAEWRLKDDSRLIDRDSIAVKCDALILSGSLRTIELSSQCGEARLWKWMELFRDAGALSSLVSEARSTIVSTIAFLCEKIPNLIPGPLMIATALCRGHYELYEYLTNRFPASNPRECWLPNNLHDCVKYCAKFPVGVPDAFVREVVEAIDVDANKYDIRRVLSKIIQHGTSEYVMILIFDALRHRIGELGNEMLQALIDNDIRSSHSPGVFFAWLITLPDKPPALHSVDWKNLFGSPPSEKREYPWKNVEKREYPWKNVLNGLRLGIIPPLSSFYMWCVQTTPVIEWCDHFEALYGFGCPIDYDEYGRFFGKWEPYRRLLEATKTPCTALFDVCQWLMAHGTKSPSDGEMVDYFLQWPVDRLDQVVALAAGKKERYFHSKLWENLFSECSRMPCVAKRMAAIRSFYPDEITPYDVNNTMKAVKVYTEKDAHFTLQLLDALKAAGISLDTSIWRNFVKHSEQPVALMKEHLAFSLIDTSLLKAAVKRAVGEKRDRNPLIYLSEQRKDLITPEFTKWAFNVISSTD